MARQVRLEATGPVKIEVRDKPVSICACGLSKIFPICDGAHKTTSRLEEPGKLYHYDPVTLAVLKVEDDPHAKPVEPLASPAVLPATTDPLAPQAVVQPPITEGPTPL